MSDSRQSNAQPAFCMADELLSGSIYLLLRLYTILD
jgi:hypothetical protein